MDKKERLTLNIPECAKLLGISRGLAFELAAQGKLPVLYLGRRRMVVPVAALEKLLAEAGTDQGKPESEEQ